MGKQFVILAVVMFMILASLALTLVGVLTDNWFYVETTSVGNQTFNNKWNYHYGIWKKCYDTLPTDIPVLQTVDGQCIFIFKDLIQHEEPKLPSDQQLYLHLSRSHVAFAILCGVVQLSAILTLICGIWPADCASSIKRAKLYLTGAVMLLFATLCGSISGICFIALRDIDVDTYHLYPLGVNAGYYWSFMVHWIATGLCLVESFILLCLLKESYEDVADKFSYYNIF